MNIIINEIAIIKELLLQRKITEAINKIIILLEKTHKNQYEFLIKDLIKIELKNKSANYDNIINILLLIINNEYKFNISDYIIKFYNEVNQNNFKKAKLYLDIISKSYILGIQCDITRELNEFLIKKETKNSFYETLSYNNSIINAINNTYQDGYILIRKMKKSLDKELKNILIYNNKIIRNDIIVNKEKITILKLINLSEKVTKEDIINKAMKEYNEKNYNKYIDEYIFLISEDKNNVNYYNKIAIGYLKLEKYEKAKYFFTQAYFLDKKNGKKSLNYEKIFEKIDNFENKKIAKDNFVSKSSNIIDIENLYKSLNITDDVLDLIYSITNVNEIVKQLDFSYEKKNILILILAKEYYLLGNDNLGDSYLRFYEKTKNKSKRTLKLYNEINKNKKFYKNREDKKLYILKK